MSHPFKRLIPVALGLFLMSSPCFPSLVSPAWSSETESNAAIAQHIEAARGYMQTSQWSVANYEWRAVLTQDPKNLEANVGLAESLLKAGFASDAVRHLEETRQFLDRLTLELTYAKALEAIGDVMGAKAVYQRNLERVPLEGESFARLMALLPSLPEEAQASLKSDLTETAKSALQQGRDALKKKNYAQAVSAFRIGVTMDASAADMNDYGLCLLLEGHYDEARQQFERAKRARSESWEVYANSAFAALGRGNSYEASVSLEKAIGLCRDTVKKPLLYNDLGFIYENQSKWQKARNAYEKAIALNPAFTKSKMNLAYAYQKDMAYPEAIRTYQDILSADPGNSRVLNRLGFVYELANKNRQALQAYEKATEVNPREQDGYYNLAILYKKIGKTKQADLSYKRLMEIEFTKMETVKDGKDKSASALASEKDSRQASGQQLLDYVDVFFLSSALPSPLAAGNKPSVQPPHEVATPAKPLPLAEDKPSVQPPHEVAIPAKPLPLAEDKPSVQPAREVATPAKPLPLAEEKPSVQSPLESTSPAMPLPLAEDKPSVQPPHEVAIPAKPLPLAEDKPSVQPPREGVSSAMPLPLEGDKP